MANNTKKSYKRGDSAHYAKLAKKSVASRIQRHIECAVVLDGDAILPTRSRETDAGFDVHALTSGYIFVGQDTKIETGVHIRCPEGYFFRVENRSSLLRAGIIVRPNIIDATYTGPLSIWATFIGRDQVCQYKFEKGDRIAQFIFYPQIHAKFKVQPVFTEDQTAQRGNAGYGSTGK